MYKLVQCKQQDLNFISASLLQRASFEDRQTEATHKVHEMLKRDVVTIVYKEVTDYKKDAMLVESTIE